MKLHAHAFDPARWPFADPVNTLAFSTRRAMFEGYPILRVSHDVEGDWQVLCGTTNDPDQAVLVCLGCLFEREPSLAGLADLPLGWGAWRDTPDSPWERFENDPDPDT